MRTNLAGRSAAAQYCKAAALLDRKALMSESVIYLQSEGVVAMRIALDMTAMPVF